MYAPWDAMAAFTVVTVVSSILILLYANIIHYFFEFGSVFLLRFYLDCVNWSIGTGSFLARANWDRVFFGILAFGAGSVLLLFVLITLF